MMLDVDVAAASPSSVYRVLSEAGLMKRHNTKASLKGTGFQQPLSPHEHWHVDIAYINVRGTFFFLCSVLDGCSRSIVHWEIRPKNEARLRSAIGYVTPADKMCGRDKQIFADRDRKLEEARTRRQAVRAQQRQVG